jgi:hypothetical protein
MHILFQTNSMLVEFSDCASNATGVHGSFSVQAGIKPLLISQSLHQTRHDYLEYEQILALLDEGILKDVSVSFG